VRARRRRGTTFAEAAHSLQLPHSCSPSGKYRGFVRRLAYVTGPCTRSLLVATTPRRRMRAIALAHPQQYPRQTQISAAHPKNWIHSWKPGVAPTLLSTRHTSPLSDETIAPFNGICVVAPDAGMRTCGSCLNHTPCWKCCMRAVSTRCLASRHRRSPGHSAAAQGKPHQGESARRRREGEPSAHKKESPPWRALRGQQPHERPVSMV